MAYHKRRHARKHTKKVAHLRPAMRKAVAKIVKGKVEVKRQYYNLADTDIYGARIYAHDLTQYITQGTGEVQRVGDTITDVTAHVSNTWAFEGLLGGTTRAWQGGHVRLLLVKTPTPLTGVAINVFTDVTGQANSVFLNPTQSVNSPINITSPIKVIAQKWLNSAQVNDIQGEYGAQGLGFMTKKLCARHKYLDGSGNQLGRQWNYYLLATASAPIAGSSDLLGKLQTTAVVTYRDA